MAMLSLGGHLAATAPPYPTENDPRKKAEEP